MLADPEMFVTQISGVFYLDNPWLVISRGTLKQENID